MPNVLVLSFEAFSFSSRQLYQHLLPKLLSRASVHESLQVQDASNYIASGWPTVVLVTDAVITFESEEHGKLLKALVEWTRQGGITLLMGFFAVAVDHSTLDNIFRQYFNLPWQFADYTAHQTTLSSHASEAVRTDTLIKSFPSRAVWLRRVPSDQIVYTTSSERREALAYAALGPVGFGKLGFIGDDNFEEFPERAILAMCHLDRDEDSLGEGVQDV